MPLSRQKEIRARNCFRENLGKALAQVASYGRYEVS